MIYYQSIIGNTREFVLKTGVDHCEITPENYDFIEVDEAFILVAPTYASETTYIMSEFLSSYQNYRYCQGIFGGGNRNFMDLFCYTAKNLAKDFALPLLHLFEFQGNSHDVNQLIKEHENLCQNLSK